MKDFNFQLFGVLRVSPVRFDGSPSWYLTFYLNLSGRGVLDSFMLEGATLKFFQNFDFLGFQFLVTSYLKYT